MEKEIVSVHVIVSGRVQGVFYRVWAKKNADELGLVGWIRNLPVQTDFDDGRVEAVFEGEKEKVEEMIKRCKKGPKLAKVTDIEVEYLDDGIAQKTSSLEIV